MGGTRYWVRLIAATSQSPHTRESALSMQCVNFYCSMTVT